MNLDARLLGKIRGVPLRSATDTAWRIVDATIGLTVEAARAGSRVGGAVTRTLRPVKDLATRPPLLPDRYQPAHLLQELADEGQVQRRAALDALRRLVPVAVAEILDQLDLTELIRARIDLDALIAAVDVDAVVARADLDAVVARLDLIGLAHHVAAGMDLSGGIQETTGSLTSAAQSGRLQGTETDPQAIAEWVDRIFRARRPETDDALDRPADPGDDQPTDPQ